MYNDNENYCKCHHCHHRRSRMITRYLLAVLFILAVSSRQLFNWFVSTMQQSYGMTAEMSELIYGMTAVILFSLFYYVLSCSCIKQQHPHEDTEENFFFIPTKRQNQILGRNAPRDAVYTDSDGVTFHFSSPGSGMCSDESCNDYGLIKGCPGRNHIFGEGNVQNLM